VIIHQLSLNFDNNWCCGLDWLGSNWLDRDLWYGNEYLRDAEIHLLSTQWGVPFLSPAIDPVEKLALIDLFIVAPIRRI